MKNYKRRWTLAFLIVAGCACLFVWYLVKDDALRPSSDLTAYVPPALNETENGASALMEASKSCLAWSGWSEHYNHVLELEWAWQLDEKEMGSLESAERLRGAAIRFRDETRMVLEASTRPYIVYPDVLDESFDWTLPKVPKELITALFYTHIWNNNPSQAGRKAISIARIGVLMGEYPQLALNSLLAFENYRIGSRLLMEASWHPDVTAGDIRSWLLTYPEFDAPASMKAALPGEFQYLAREIQRYADGYGALQGDLDDPFQELPSWLPKAYLFKPNRTQNLLADLHRELIRDFESYKLHQQKQEQPLPGLFELENALGITLVSILGDALKRLVAKAYNILATHEGTRTCLAVRLFELETGALPRTLDDLVPEYLAEIPMDPFDHKPLRYVPERRLVYSVGPKLQDHGGDLDWHEWHTWQFAARTRLQPHQGR